MDWVLIILGTQVIKKKRPVRPVFPDYLSVSYDYDYIECDKEQAENKKHRTTKTSFPKEPVENAGLHKPVFFFFLIHLIFLII